MSLQILQQRNLLNLNRQIVLSDWIQRHKLGSRRDAYRRTVDAPGIVTDLCTAEWLVQQCPGSDALAPLLPARDVEIPRGLQPAGQWCRSPTRQADQAPHPAAFVLIIVSLAQSPAVTNDRIVVQNRASTGQEIQLSPTRYLGVRHFDERTTHGLKAGR